MAERLLSFQDVSRETTLSVSTIRRLIAEGRFPTPKRLIPGRVVFDAAEVERQERINEDVLRYLTVRVDAHEEGPSAMMRKADRDRERDERGFGDRGGRFGDRDRGERRFGDRDRGERRPRDGGDEAPAQE